ncbi:EAL domain-containing protein [Ideonella paludis]|uniref:EAL domain-containing protein n=2 Tax=Ideonella paludis TaxID=1233411 RepID=A0ABS5DX38_9BURK|nr:EAL domain-containing protein [Ideonella paludis]MBQ0935715.1 EAL domain-containing protein [Ideonella paludis]
MSVIRWSYAWVVLMATVCMAANAAWLWWSPLDQRLTVLGGVLGIVAVCGALTVGGLMLLVRYAKAPLRSFKTQIRALSDRQFIELQEPKVSEWVTLSKALNVMVARVQMMLTERDEAVDRMKRKAGQDALTQLASRQRLMEVMAKAVRHEGPGGAVAIFRLQDLDGLNKRLGRQRADDLLVAVATALNARLLLDKQAAEAGVLARLNGSEFGLLLPPYEVEALAHLLAAMSNTIAQLSVDGLADVPLVVRIGATSFRAGEEASDVLLRADAAVGRAEFEQKAMVISQPSPKHHTLAVAQWRVIIESALDNGHLSHAFYPVTDGEGRVLHQEAFLRLKEPHGVIYEAAEFLPPAVRCGRTMELDLRAVALGLAQIAEQGQAVAVNCALQSTQHPMFMRRLDELLTRYAGHTHLLWVEVRDPDVASVALPSLLGLGQLLQRHGCQFGLDNMGWSYSLRQAIGIEGLQYIKLAPDLCRAACQSLRARSLVEVMVAWAKRSQCVLVACGLEDDSQLAALKALGLQYFSGQAATQLSRRAATAPTQTAEA